MTTGYRIANAPCSWGILDLDPTHQISYARFLDEVQATGYEGTELGAWGFMPTDAAELDRQLKARKLGMVGAFVQVSLWNEGAHADGIATAVQTAKLLAAAHKLQPHLPPPRLVLSDTIDADPNRKAKAGKITAADQMTPKQWDAFAKGSNRLAAEVLAQSGLKTVFHHHCAHFIETPAEVETLMAKTDPKLLGLCLDTGHFMVGGASVKADPVAALKQYGDRVWHVHFKDCQPSLTEGRTFYEAVNQQLFCEMGKGVVDFKAMLKELDARNYQGWIVVEQDILPGQQDNAKPSAGRNRQYLKNLGV